MVGKVEATFFTFLLFANPVCGFSGLGFLCQLWLVTRRKKGKLGLPDFLHIPNQTLWRKIKEKQGHFGMNYYEIMFLSFSVGASFHECFIISLLL